MKSSQDVWTVTQTLGTGRAGEQGYDPRLEAAFRTETIPVELVCTKPSDPGLTFTVSASLRTMRYHRQGETWREPYQLTDATRIAVEGDDLPSTALFKSIGLGSLHKAINDFYADLARGNAADFTRPRALPKPGAKGSPDGVYATWAAKVIAAREQHGRGYMKHLLAEHPGYTRSNILRMVDRAEDLGLYKPEPTGSGQLGKGHLTAKGRRLTTGDTK